MHKTIIVTLLVQAVLILVGGVMAPALAATNKVVLSADQAVKAKIKQTESKFSTAIVLVRGTSLYDFQDGSKKDSMDYLFIPSYKTALGSVTAKIIYSQDLKDNSPGASDFADSTITFAKSAIKWEWSSPYILTLTPTLTAVVPLSKNSIQRDQLQTSIIAGVSFGIIPDGLAKESGWSAAIGLTAGRNFHQYQESLGNSANSAAISICVSNAVHSIKCLLSSNNPLTASLFPIFFTNELTLAKLAARPPRRIGTESRM